MKHYPLVPSNCPICGSEWYGGCQIPDAPFPKVGVRTFYRCGSKVSVNQDLSFDDKNQVYLIKVSGCQFFETN